MEKYFINGFTISVISKIELLGWTGYLKDSKAYSKANELVSFAEILAVDEFVSDAAIETRELD